jgi:hypothetical protein
VQILTNFEHLEQACAELETLLVEARSSSSAAGPISLSATAEFRAGKKKAEVRIFELVNSKIDDLIETAEYDWLSTFVPEIASPYMQELTRYLSNIMSSVLIGLPEKIKDQIYHESLGHIAAAILSLPLDSNVRQISSQASTAYSLDVGHLVAFVESLPKSDALLQMLEELRQTTALMTLAAEGMGEQFFDSSVSGLKFGKVDKIKGAELLEKVMVAPAEGGDPRPSTTLGRLSTQVAGMGGNTGGSPVVSERKGFADDWRGKFGKFASRER